MHPSQLISALCGRAAALSLHCSLTISLVRDRCPPSNRVTELARRRTMWPEGHRVRLKVEFEQEEDGRWIAEVPELPGVLAYGANQPEARSKVQALALRVVADRLEHGEADPGL